MTDQKTTDKRASIERRWKKYQALTGYTDEELAIFRSFPQNVKAMEDAPEMVKNDVVVEIIDVKNCIAGYKVGDTFRVDPYGMLMLDQCPPKICTAAVFAFKPIVSYAWQALFDGSKMVFHRTVRCPDVGVCKEGTGEITMKIHIIPHGQKFEPQVYETKK